MPLLPALVVAIALATGVGTSAAAAPASVPRSGLAGSANAAAAVPRPDHIVVVVEENHSGSEIVGNSNAPYISSLADENANLTSSYAITHPSEPNYVALFSGSTQGLTSDACPVSYSATSLGDELLDAGLGFAGYSEGLPSAGFTGCSSGDYRRKHSPWVNFPSLPAATNQPFIAFPDDYATLPEVSFVIPDLQDDMHDGSVAQGDRWLRDNLSGYVEWAKTHNSLFVLTFDEDDHSAGNRIATVFAGEQVKPGSYAEQVNHYNVLRTIQDAYSLPPLGASASAPALTDIWSAGDPPVGGEQPIARFTSSCDASVCSFDASGSADPDGSVTGYTWDFGDGTVGSGVTIVHTYQAGGTYPVTLNVTDDQDESSSVTHPATVGSPDPQIFVSDQFERAVTGGLGVADLGGTWTTSGPDSAFSVADGDAALRVTRGQWLRGELPDVTRSSANVLTGFSLDSLPSRGAVYMSVFGRQVDSHGGYAAQVVIGSDGSVTLRLNRMGAQKARLVRPAIVSAVSLSPDTVLDVRVQVSGTSPTLIRARVWSAWEPEPAEWQVTTTDSTAVLQHAGSVGLTVWANDGISNDAITLHVDSLTAAAPSGG